MTSCQPQNVKAASLSNASRHVTGALHDVIGSREQRRTAERENDGIGVQRPQATIGKEGQVKIELRPDQLSGEENTDQHANDAPDHDHDRKLTHYRVVVRSCFIQREDPYVLSACFSWRGGAVTGFSPFIGAAFDESRSIIAPW